MAPHRPAGRVALLLAALAIVAHHGAAQELANRAGGRNTTSEFEWLLRWSPANGAAILAPNSDAVTMPSFPPPPPGPGWSGIVERGQFGGSTLFDDFRFRARHVLGPHARGDFADVNPNPGDGTFFDLFLLVDALALPGTPTPDDYVDVPTRVGGGAGLVGSATERRDHPVVRGAPHFDEFQLRYRTVVAGAGGTVDFVFTGIHLCEPRPPRSGVGPSAADVDACDCGCSVVPEPSGDLLLATGLTLFGATITVVRRRVRQPRSVPMRAIARETRRSRRSVPSALRVVSALVVAFVVAFVAVAPSGSAQELATRGARARSTRFDWEIRWRPANGAAPGEILSMADVRPEWDAQVERGAFGGNALFDDFVFRARHNKGPHENDINPNPDEDEWFDLFTLIDGTALLAPAGLDPVDVPTRVGAGAGLEGDATVTKVHPIVIDDAISKKYEHIDVFDLKYWTSTPGEGGRIDFTLTGVHSCRPREPAPFAVGAEATDPGDCQCECALVAPEPASLALLATGLSAATAGAWLGRVRRRRLGAPDGLAAD